MRRPKNSTVKTENMVPLDQKQIVETALALLDEVGFDGLTMRSLADKLGIKAASLYWHVRDKQELMGLVADAICAPMQEPDRALPWRERLEALGYEYRRVLLAHRDAARVFASGGAPSGPNQLRLSEIVLGALLDAGFSGKDAAYAGLLVNDFVVTFVAEEERRREGRMNSEQWKMDNEKGVEKERERDGQSVSEYPNMAAVGRYLMLPDMDERFAFGMEILRAGLEARLEKGK